ncbi:hypothetical protein C4559_06390 [Candidatus Microgenomates bacterium]|nr:MAG: hypothetical protein C4559_06390 [Candidatus Microgenomates bacterium]
MQNKKIFIPFLAIAVLVITGVLLTSTQVQAQTKSNPLSGLVKAISQKFGLNESQVQAVVNDYNNQQKQNVQQNMQKREQNKLDALVKQGKITAAQKQAILDEQAKLKKEYSSDSLKNLTPVQRKQQIQKMQEEIKLWAKSQGTNLSYIMPFGMGGFRGGMHKGWLKPTVTPKP